VRITYDPDKRAETLKHRKLDFEDTPKLFAAAHFQMEDDRRDYGETRWITVGRLGRDIVVVVWTPRDQARRIISMRKCHGKERKTYLTRLDRSG
jgi:uncharacterized DUF497 family protein